MDIVWTIIIGLLLLTFFVVMHEWGHYIAAKRAGITVLEFSIGFGPAIYKRMMRNGTQFSIRCLPFGGYCKFFGEEDGDEKKPGAFNHASISQRFWTFVCGPAMNVLVAFILAVAFLCAFGDYHVNITSVNPGSPAQAAGLQAGDRITQLNGVKVDFLMDVYEAQQNTKGEYSETTVMRNGQSVSVKVPYAVQDGVKRIGINIEMVPVKYSFFEAIGLSFTWLFDLTRQMLSALGALIFTGQGVQDLAGPVGTINIIGAAAKSGAYIFLQISALISLNLAIINLLPFPALDGGQIVLLGVEAVRRKPVPLRVVSVLNTIGLMLIFGFAIYLTFQDIGRLTGG